MSKSVIMLSSLTKKFLMAFAGLFLVMFLPVHLGINLFILPLTENHVEIFKEAVHFMTTNPLIKVMEIVLFSALFLHMIFGVILWFENRQARPVGYKVSQKSKVYSPASRFMIHTGIMVFIFLVLHFINFYFVKLGLTSAPVGPNVAVDNHDFYNMALNLFSQPMYSILYVVLICGLGVHLHHAFQSAFQSLGLNHPIYTPVIKGVGLVYSIVITAGFISIPIFFMLQ